MTNRYRKIINVLLAIIAVIMCVNIVLCIMLVAVKNDLVDMKNDTTNLEPSDTVDITTNAPTTNNNPVTNNITTDKPTTIEPAKNIKYCNTDVLNVRKGPSTKYTIIGQLVYNQEVEILGEEDGWYKINFKGSIGYVSATYISDTKYINEVAEQCPDDELWLLAHLISGEAQFCDDTEQRYVGSVVLNRMKHSAYPDTMKEVIFQKGQYACTWTNNLFLREPTQSNWDNARWLLENGSILPDNVIYQAQFPQGSGVYVQTQYHYYCYE